MTNKYMYNSEMGTIAKMEDYESTYDGSNFSEWASEHLVEISLTEGIKIEGVFTNVETESFDTVEVGCDIICCVCGKVIPASETHCENVLICDGFTLAVLDAYHNECD